MQYGTKEALYYNAVAIALAGDYGKLAKLKERWGLWESAYAALATTAGSSPEPEKAWQTMQGEGVSLLMPEDASYPPLLREIFQPPFGIYFRGEFSVTAPSIAIVGTRRATHEGKDIARRFARELAEAGLMVVSGLALGMDAAAHQGALNAGAAGGAGRTIAVLAGGLNDIYPHENRRLADDILAAHGAIISEYPYGAVPYSGRFLERNRIVSGIAQGVLVVEAPLRSGSLSTARFAEEQNRDVFVVPGAITQKNFEGSHALIRQGATLVTSSMEILEAYGITKEMRDAASATHVSNEEKLILKALREISGPANVDKITEIARLEPRIVNGALSFLLIKGLIKETPGGYTI